MAVVSLIGALEEHFGIAIDDDDISASTFETLGSLAAFVARDRDSLLALSDAHQERLETAIAALPDDTGLFATG